MSYELFTSSHLPNEKRMKLNKPGSIKLFVHDPQPCPARRGPFIANVNSHDHPTTQYPSCREVSGAESGRADSSLELPSSLAFRTGSLICSCSPGLVFLGQRTHMFRPPAKTMNFSPGTMFSGMVMWNVSFLMVLVTSTLSRLVSKPSPLPLIFIRRSMISVMISSSSSSPASPCH